MTDMKIKRDLQKTAETPVLNTGFMEITGVSAHNKSAREESCGGKHQQMWITQHTHTHTRVFSLPAQSHDTCCTLDEMDDSRSVCVCSRATYTEAEVIH